MLRLADCATIVNHRTRSMLFAKISFLQSSCDVEWYSALGKAMQSAHDLE